MERLSASCMSPAAAPLVLARRRFGRPRAAAAPAAPGHRPMPRLHRDAAIDHQCRRSRAVQLRWRVCGDGWGRGPRRPLQQASAMTLSRSTRETTQRPPIPQVAHPPLPPRRSCTQQRQLPDVQARDARLRRHRSSLGAPALGLTGLGALPHVLAGSSPAASPCCIAAMACVAACATESMVSTGTPCAMAACGVLVAEGAPPRGVLITQLNCLR